jgi:hypothetical protein
MARARLNAWAAGGFASRLNSTILAAYRVSVKPVG